MLTLIGISLFAVGVIDSPPPDISGNWQGEDWGQVTLTQTAPGEYTGTYTDTVAKEKVPGKIDLKWSRIERRYQRHLARGRGRPFRRPFHPACGQRDSRRTDDQPKSKINPATPRLADLAWTRTETKTGRNRPALSRPAFRPEALRGRAALREIHLGRFYHVAVAQAGIELRKECRAK